MRRAAEVDGVNDLVGGGIDDVHGVGSDVDYVDVAAIPREPETVNIDLSVVHRAQDIRVRVQSHCAKRDCAQHRVGARIDHADGV
jgi:hypothetical protein